MMRRGAAQVNPDQESLQRLKQIRGEVDAPMRAPPPARTAQVRAQGPPASTDPLHRPSALCHARRDARL